MCEHDWRAGPFYVMAAGTYEEPHFYPPSWLIKVEHCTRCGLLRLSEKMRAETETNLSKEART